MIGPIKFQSLSVGIKFITIPSVLLVMVLFGVWLMTPTEASRGMLTPTPQILPQSISRWNVHMYAMPSGEGGTDLIAAVGRTDDVCEEVTFNAEYLGVPTPFEGLYGLGERYIGTVSDFFPYGTETQEGALEAVCELSSGDKLVTDRIVFKRYYAQVGSETSVRSPDGNAELYVFTTSLSQDIYIVVMTTNTLPGALPVGVKLVGEPYSFRPSGLLLESDNNMELTLKYGDDTLGSADPLTLRILEWDAGHDTWVDAGEQSNFDYPDPRVNKPTTKFTTYILVSTPLWFDSFTDGRGLDTMDNINRIMAGGGKLKLDITSVPGIAISKPYTPTMEIGEWKFVSYTANITAEASLAVSVLSRDGTILESNVTPGQSLADIDPGLYPSLRLRVDMSTTSGTSPELFDWSILAEPGIYEVYLPVILRN